MKISRHIIGLIISGTLVLGCSNEQERQEPPPEKTASKAAALTAAVQEAADNPSGTVDGGTIQGVLDAQLEMDLATLGGIGVGGFDIDVDAAGGFDCATGSALEGTIDMACASGGDVTGTISYAISTAGGVAYVYASFNQLCVPADDLCMNGETAVESGADQNGSRSVVAGNLTLVRGGQTDELRYGVSVTAGAGGVEEKVVLWHNGDSYVVTTQAGAGGVSYSVEGANGTWSCSVSGSESSWTGTCSSDGDAIEF